jgi:auxin efflux carrier family protein
MASFFTKPTSYRLNAVVAGDNVPSIATNTFSTSAFLSNRGNTHESHPALGHLVLLVFEAVMEVVCVSLPGYIVARQGMFDADKQKFLANLNVALFTPCLSRWITS